MGGGGGSSTTVATSGLIDDLRPVVTKLINDRVTAYDEDIKDPNNIVAELSQQQKDAFTAQTNTANDMMSGQGTFDYGSRLNRDLSNTLGGGMGAASMGGALGSARSQAAIGQAMGDVSMNYLEKEQGNILKGSEMLGNVGTSMQQQKQKVLDAPHTATSRIFQYLGAGPTQSVQTTKGGGK